VSSAAHGTKRKVRRRGRHSAPSQVHKVAKAAGKAAPAVAVVGALTAVPQVRDFVLSDTPAVTAGHRPAAQVADPDQVTNAAADDNAASLNFVAFSHFVEGAITGLVFSVFIIVLAAAEAAIALAIVVSVFRHFHTIDAVDTSTLKE